MNEKAAPYNSRVAAATAILDRGWGKPTQPLGGENGKPIKVQAIAWLDSMTAGDSAKLVEGTTERIPSSKENGQKALTNGHSSHSITEPVREWPHAESIEERAQRKWPTKPFEDEPAGINSQQIAIADEVPE